MTQRHKDTKKRKATQGETPWHRNDPETIPQISLIARSDADIAIFGGDLNAQVQINIIGILMLI